MRKLTKLLKSILHQAFSRFFWPLEAFREHLIKSSYLDRTVTVDVYPARWRSTDEATQLFCFLDGQDVRQMNIATHLKRFPASIMVVGIHANAQRMEEYGTISQADYAGRGAKAAASARFIIEELLPYLEQHYAFRPKAENSYVAGFSLSGLLAFDLAWHYPQHFATAGVFSGALWWRSKKFRKTEPDANRILHTQVAAATELPDARFWFQAGTEDEQEDRNNNGIIDAIDDTLQLINLLKDKGILTTDVYYLEMEGGRHEPATWARALPHFFQWSLRQPMT